MKTSKRIKNLLEIGIYIENNSGVKGRELANHFGVSQATMKRSLRTLRECEVQVVWDKRTLEYSVLDWGIFAKNRIQRLYNNQS